MIRGGGIKFDVALSRFGVIFNDSKKVKIQLEKLYQIQDESLIHRYSAPLHFRMVLHQP